MRDRITDLINARPEQQFSRDTAGSKFQSLFGNDNAFAVGMGLGRKLGHRPAFMNATKKFGHGNFLRTRLGG